MGLSAGGFFKNFVKGAAQQYNTNIAYVEQQKVEEEKAIKKEERQFKYDKRLKDMDFAGQRAIENIKSEGKKKNLLSITLPNSQSVFTVPNTIDGKELSLTNLDPFTKNKTLYEAFKYQVNQLSEASIDTYRKNGDLNVIANTFADRWYQQLPTFKQKDANGNETIGVTLETTDWNYINSIPEFQEAAAKKLGTTVELLQQRAIDQGDYVVDNSVAMKPSAEGSRFEVTLADVVPAKYNLQTSHIDILKKQAPRFNKYDPAERVKIAPLVQEIDTTLKLPENQPEKGQVTMREMVDAIGAATPVLANIKEPKRLDSFAMEELKTQLRAANIDPYIYNDVDLLGKVISLSLPDKFKSAKVVNFAQGQPVQLGSNRVIQDIIGSKKALQNVALKARLAGDLESDAAAVEQLSMSGADIGLATTPQAIQNLLSVSSQVVMDGIGLIVEKTTGKQVDSKFVFQDMFKNANEKLQKGMQSQNMQDRKNALLEFYATTMAFRMAAQIQNTGDTGSGPRISDDDVRRIAQGLSQNFINNPDKLQSVARGVRLAAERERKIYQMYRSDKVHQIVTASILEDMYQGSLPIAVQELTGVQGGSGVQVRGTYQGTFDTKINVITEKEKDKIDPPPPPPLGKNKNLFPPQSF